MLRDRPQVCRGIGYNKAMRRVLVMGCSGSGKTTLARRIAERYGLTWSSLDSVFWKPGWVESTDEEFFPKVEALMEEPRWVIDGTYTRTLHLRLPYADTVIWLDLPRRTCLLSIVRRVMLNYGTVRPELPEGCAEKWDWEFMRWIWNYRRTHDHLHIERLMEWLGRAPVRGECTEGSNTTEGVIRRVWWLANRRQFGWVLDSGYPSRPS